MCDETKETNYFSFDNYEVVTVTSNTTLKEPSITLGKGQFYFNAMSIKALDNVSHVQILMDSANKKLAIRKCDRFEKNSVAWCTQKFSSKKLNSPVFNKKLFELMNWSEQCTYRCFGKLVQTEKEELLIFDLSTGKIFVPKEFPKNIEKQ